MSRGQPSGQTKESFTAGHPVPAVNETATVSKTPAESTASRSPAHPNGAWCHAKRSPACHWLRGDIGYCVYAVPGPLRAELVREPVSRGLGEFLCCASLEVSWTAHGGLRNPARRKYGGWQRGADCDGRFARARNVSWNVGDRPLHFGQCSSPSEHGRQIRRNPCDAVAMLTVEADKLPAVTRSSTMPFARRGTSV